MSYKIRTIPKFEKEFKHLSKKYPSLKQDLMVLADKLQADPQSGQPIGNDCYKIRVAITSKGKGKSGGARVITYLKVSQTTVYLLSIYDKSEKEDISATEVKYLISFIS